jgi:hypothetical protein
MKLVIDVPDLTPGQLAAIGNHEVMLECRLCTWIRVPVTSAVQVKEYKHSDGFGGHVPVWRRS